MGGKGGRKKKEEKEKKKDEARKGEEEARDEKAENVGYQLENERRRVPRRRQGREGVLGRASLSGKLLIP